MNMAGVSVFKRLSGTFGLIFLVLSFFGFPAVSGGAVSHTGASCQSVVSRAAEPAGGGLFARYADVLTTPAYYVCYRPEGKIKVDGKLDESSWKKARPTARFADISGEGHPEPVYGTTAKMLWDDDYIYVSAVLEESNIKARLTQRDTIIYHDNDFEVFIDPDGDGQNYFEIEVNALGTVFDLMLDRPYRNGGNFMIQWNCPGLKMAVKRHGSLNRPDDKDDCWVVEMAIPGEAIKMNFTSPLVAGACLRLNFSRVEWLKPGEREENWVWCPTGRVDMHMPDRWGFLYLSDKSVGMTGAFPAAGHDGNAGDVRDRAEVDVHYRTLRKDRPNVLQAGPGLGCDPDHYPVRDKDDFVYPYDMDAYKLVWAMFYAQMDKFSGTGNYIRSVDYFHFTDAELAAVPEGGKVSVAASGSAFKVSVSVPAEGVTYNVDNNGRFTVEKIEPRKVRNWVWLRPDRSRSDESWSSYFALLKECGISGAMFEGYDERIYRLCKEAGLEAHHWKWTMNRRELMETHPDWFAVNRKGESSFDKPAYVDYYRFICPYHEGVAEYLAEDYLMEANRPYVDGVHLDYVRFPDVVLPVSLWKNYGIEQTSEHAEYDYCYCDVCRSKFKALTGRDPMDVQFPMEDQSWINFRLDGITSVVRTITARLKSEGKHVSAAVFPGPSMARKMVRQDWGNWPLDAYFPMIYNGFYYEGPEWIGRSVSESVKAVGGNAAVYAGLMFPDIRGCFEEALDEAFDNGASGVSFFDGPDEEYLRRFKAYLEKRGFVVF